MIDLKKAIEWLDSNGCSNHGCEIRHTPVFVGTNATCQCIRSAVERGDYRYISRVLQCKKLISDEHLSRFKEYMQYYSEGVNYEQACSLIEKDRDES